MKKSHLILLALALLAALLCACGRQSEAAGQPAPQESAASTREEPSSVSAPAAPPKESSAPAAGDAPAAPSAPPSALPEESAKPAPGGTEAPPESPKPAESIDVEEMLTIEEGSNGTTYIFSALPQNAEELKALWEHWDSAPEHTAAFCIAAFCRYPASREDSLAMIDLLRGPSPMNEADRQFIADRFRDKDYVPRSYLAGAVPDNNYTPTEPFTLTITADAHSYDTENVARLYVQSGGADSPRPLSLRLAKDGNWYLWEYSSILVGIRLPASEDPWA